jgi:hypothetical protein
MRRDAIYGLQHIENLHANIKVARLGEFLDDPSPEVSETAVAAIRLLIPITFDSPVVRDLRQRTAIDPA